MNKPAKGKSDIFPTDSKAEPTSGNSSAANKSSKTKPKKAYTTFIGVDATLKPLLLNSIIYIINRNIYKYLYTLYIFNMKFIYTILALVLMPIQLSIYFIMYLIEYIFRFITQSIVFINNNLADVGNWIFKQLPWFTETLNTITLKIIKWKSK